MPPSSQFVCSTRARRSLSKPLKTMVVGAIVLSCIYYVIIGGDGSKRKEPMFREIDVARDLPFDVNKDVFAPLNIPKTGTQVLVYYITHNSDIKPRCRFFKAKGFMCVSATNSTWLLGESKKGSNCGSNSDWTELTECIEARFGENEGKTAPSSYRYITLLRDPVQRFISEFLRTKKIVKIADVNSCHGRLPSQLELPDCFDGASNLTLDWFLACRSNLAINRQTRMLADLRLVNCYNKTGMTEQERDRRLLESAKENLLKMSFFGLTDYQHLSQVVFEETFHVKFLLDFEEFNVTHASKAVISPSDLERIAKVNHNDVELYNFAKSLLIERAIYMNLQ
ncbi:heparan-sulfate 6-O-sulfotransferase 2-like [Haliotis rufescens]|uniref:heparan-sulfate 6-O-sulfotransferase 2-like n=1 Tax=Haliotis rufescens TaxID=6454 RepID=UPI00201EF91D|nr:heparan-sulfate 6-O-sulfotransferase 2-like [Haliotis rufescens]